MTDENMSNHAQVAAQQRRIPLGSFGFCHKVLIEKKMKAHTKAALMEQDSLSN